MRSRSIKKYVKAPLGVAACIGAVILAVSESDPVVGVLIGAAGVALLGNARGHWSDGVQFVIMTLAIGGFAVWIGTGGFPIDDLYSVVFGVLAIGAAVRAYLFYAGHLAPEPATPE